MGLGSGRSTQKVRSCGSRPEKCKRRGVTHMARKEAGMEGSEIIPRGGLSGVWRRIMCRGAADGRARGRTQQRSRGPGRKPWKCGWQVEIKECAAREIGGWR